MDVNDWVEEFPAAVTVCDADGRILSMNRRSAETFAAEGGKALIGRSLLDCHPEPARSHLAGMLVNPKLNAYTIEKNGVKKLIYQAPWFQDGAYAGYVELSLPVPAEMSHFVRQ